jgi:hypothetical protein
MTEDESRRAVDVGDMYAVLPSIDTGGPIVDAYAGRPPAPVGAYRSDHGDLMDRQTIVDLLHQTVIPGVVG